VKSKSYHLFQDSVTKTDTVNSFKVESIIRSYGWPGADQVGKSGVEAICFLYQKLSFKDQKRYYPFLVDGFKNGLISAENFAALTDKIALRDKGKQIYGTQVRADSSLLPVENKDSLNFRRTAIGLPVH
jgi:hypothetical protein